MAPKIANTSEKATQRKPPVLGKYRRLKALFEKKKESKKQRSVRRRERRSFEAKGFNLPAELERQVPFSIESLKKPDETRVSQEDQEIDEENATDEFSEYFSGKKAPKLMVSTSRRPSAKLHDFLTELMLIIPNIFYYKRGPNSIKDLSKYAANNNFTDLLIITEKNRTVNGLYIGHLPEGPTSFFKLTNLKLAQQMKGGATATDHRPEIILNHFDSRLGHRLGRQLAALFPQTPEFRGRRVITLHNQRDFIFFRHHRYIFDDEGNRCRLQEIGPRFTLKLHWMQVEKNYKGRLTQPEEILNIFGDQICKLTAKLFSFKLSSIQCQ
ncbi:putative IMP4 family U3 small nucleolar ribonucleoprotein (snoRNP) [Cardiosporidium cionae]|uniref:IMP4 family U3 small nucleolar ribonucleoprotein (snoRNP) n=1 Tax=Cardiosporidium cionae TaxID=476202 RepID=A0ABQ7JAR7_9APIC|nr:putative IMP4 family U3 small nucleolar ribonucleoprotein (snoRNP) [Cardiosporidium cionae]|eukprot:KAF8821097.1 putative IMP4 family U3 small nucleolar ribonucleoprotein (snoRNP) [Cardiosporidium cionae]